MGSLCNSIVHQIWHRVACATNCFAHAHTIALCMFAQLLCACPIYTSHRHAHAIALHMRKPLLCTCASHYFAHARPIILRTSTIHKHAPGSPRLFFGAVQSSHKLEFWMFSVLDLVKQISLDPSLIIALSCHNITNACVEYCSICLFCQSCYKNLSKLTPGIFHKRLSWTFNIDARTE